MYYPRRDYKRVLGRLSVFWEKGELEPYRKFLVNWGRAYEQRWDTFCSAEFRAQPTDAE